MNCAVSPADRLGGIEKKGRRLQDRTDTRARRRVFFSVCLPSCLSKRPRLEANKMFAVDYWLAGLSPFSCNKAHTNRPVHHRYGAGVGFGGEGGGWLDPAAIPLLFSYSTQVSDPGRSPLLSLTPTLSVSLCFPLPYHTGRYLLCLGSNPLGIGTKYDVG